ncbi:MAG: SMC family ATPase [Gemmatimonadota bacterium]
MLINRLRLVNFRQHEDTELVLGAGLTGIVGANGAGKTTILEALAWAIYGMPAARGGRDSIRRRQAPARSPVSVELEFSLGQHRYRVVRTLNSAFIYQDGESAPFATSLGTVTEKLTSILGMSRSDFFNTYFTGQKELKVMAAMTGPEKAQFLSRVLGYEKLKEAQDRLRERRGTLRTQLQTLESTLQDTAELEADESLVQARIDRGKKGESDAIKALEASALIEQGLKPRLEAMQNLKHRVSELNGELKLADHKVTEARDRHEQLDRQLIEALSARDRLQPLLEQLKPLALLKSEGERLDALERTVSARQGFEAQLNDLQKRRKSVGDTLAAIPKAQVIAEAAKALEEKRNDRIRIAGIVEEQRTTWVRDSQDVKTKLENLVTQFNEFKEQLDQINRLGPDGACPTCTRPLGKEFVNVKGLLERQLQAVADNGKYYKQRVKQLAKTPVELTSAEKGLSSADKEIQKTSEHLGQLRARAAEETRLRKEQAELKEQIEVVEAQLAASAAPYDRKRHQEVRRQLSLLDDTALQAERLKGLAERAESLVKDAEIAERTLSERERHARELRQQMETLGYRDADHKALLLELESANKTRHEADLSVIRVRAELSNAEEALRQVARRREERARRELEMREVSVGLRLHGEVDRAFTDLRSDLNSELRPNLSDAASIFLTEMTEGRYSSVDLDEDYNARVLVGDEERQVISGGEEDMVNLALRLAISQMISQRAGQPLSLLVLDEIFGSLDEERRVSVVELLRGLTDKFPQIILISHVESITGLDRMIRVAVDLDRGTSFVREEGGYGGLAA